MKHWRRGSGLVSRLGNVSLVLLALGVTPLIDACSSDPQSDDGLEQAGSLGLQLQVAPGVTLNSVSYTITGNGFTKTGTIDTSNAPAISATIGGIPAGNGYKITLTATSVETLTTFTGSATFNVSAGKTASVTVRLLGKSESGNGSVLVNGSLNIGPVIDELTATPLSAFVGNKISLKALASDPDNGPSALSYLWSTSGGTLDTPSGASAKLTSSTPGTVTVTLAVSDGDITSTATASVTFLDSGAGSGGAPSAGGANAGGASSTAGASTGGASSGGAPAAAGASAGGAPGTGGSSAGGASSAGGTSTGGASTGGAGGTGSQQSVPLTLVSTAVAPNTASVTTTVVQIPSSVQPSDVAVVFVLSTGNSAVVASPEGFVTKALFAAQHNLSYGPVGNKTSLTWTSAATATTGAIAFFFRGNSIAVEALNTNQDTTNAFGQAASSKAPQSAFDSGYALFGIQLPVSGTPTITAGPAAPWLAPVTDGKQLFTWAQPYVAPASGFLFPATSGTLSAAATKRQAQVFVGSSLP
jgi:hypothetical protein